MKYELECAHCGCLLELELDPRARSAGCTICGGQLTIAIAVLLPTPPEPLPAPVPPVPVPRPFSPLPPRGAKPAPVPFPPPRPKRLGEAWVAVRHGLRLASLGALLALALCVPLLIVSALAAPFNPLSQSGPVKQFLIALMVAHILPYSLHLAGQFKCLDNLPSGHGRPIVLASFVLMLLSWLCAFGLSGPVSAPVVLGFAALNLGAFGVWLLFLLRLGEHLGDVDFLSAAGAQLRRFGRGVPQMAVLLFFGYRFARWGNDNAPGFFLLAAGGVAVFVLWRYSVLLRVATEAIERRAPRR